VEVEKKKKRRKKRKERRKTMVAQTNSGLCLIVQTSNLAKVYEMERLR